MKLTHQQIATIKSLASKRFVQAFGRHAWEKIGYNPNHTADELLLRLLFWYYFLLRRDLWTK